MLNQLFIYTDRSKKNLDSGVYYAKPRPEKDDFNLEFIRRYDNLSVEQVNKIIDTSRSHKGSQDILFEKIDWNLNNILESEGISNKTTDIYKTLDLFFTKYSTPHKFPYQDGFRDHKPGQLISTPIIEDTIRDNLYQANLGENFLNGSGEVFQGTIGIVPKSDKTRNLWDLIEYIKKNKKGKILVGPVSSNIEIQKLLIQIE